MFLDYFALFLVLFVVVFIFYAVIAIHDIPYEIAQHRNHPHQDAIHIAGWVSLFTLHVLWPFLWIWATLYRPDRGWGLQNSAAQDAKVEQMMQQIEQLSSQVEQLKQATQAESISTPDIIEDR